MSRLDYLRGYVVVRYTLPDLAGTPRPYLPTTPASIHNVTVTAVDDAGNVETVIRTSGGGGGYNSYTWLVDDRPPVTSFTSTLPPR
jgi:hypothetical protein